MCGIAGFLGADRSSHALAGRMAAALHHRGPDDGGVERITHNNATAGALAARRLAIRDVTSAGHQPMVSDDRRFTLVYNGELYNASEIRRDLEQNGVVFRGHSDTEVLLHAFATHGPSILPALRGMFAFCFYDATSGVAHICRDRFGIKPLYIASVDNSVLFASELRALLATERVPRVLDDTALGGYLATGSVPEPRTLLRDVTMVPAGTFVTVSPEFRASAPQPYLDIPLIGATPGARDCGTSALAVHGALADSVERHLVSDVPTGVFLSGGIDSAAIVALIAEHGGRPDTFTVCFEQERFNEASIARTVSSRFGTRHHDIMLRGNDVLEMLPSFFAASDHPSVDGLNTYCIAEAVHARDITVALSGLGGDEMFAGYPSFRRARRLSHLPMRRGLMRRFLSRAPGGDETKREQVSQMMGDADPALASYLASRMLFTPHQVAQLMHAGERTAASLMGINDSDHVSGRGPDVSARRKQTARRLMNRVSALELEHYTRNTLLRDADIFTMAHSLELRVPFLDPAVAIAAGAASDRCKIAGRRPKPLLLDAIGGAIPPAVWRRPKQGFVLPLEDWLQHELRDEAVSVLSSRVLADAGLRSNHLRDVWRAFERKPSSRTTSRVWTLYALAKWLEQNRVTRG
jgi:asparagine synthase (glutamine-hydrolysing)